MLNWSLRYLPVVAILDQSAATTVLDVGSGWHGLSRYRPGPVVQTDLGFDGPRPDAPRVGHATYVCASADRLPFLDGAFDFVVSLDLIEHLPAALRRSAIGELTRVARRGVVLGFPVGDPARQADVWISRGTRLTGRPPPPWLDEHLAQPDYPAAADVPAALPDGWSIASTVPLGNAHLMVAVVMAEQLPGLNRLARRADRWYRRRGPVRMVDRGTPYRRLWLITPD